MEVNIYNLEGAVTSKTKLPKVFETPYRPRIIERAVLAAESARIQPKGPSHSSGRNTTAVYIGRRSRPNSLMNKGIARKPRTKNRPHLVEGTVKGIPGVVGGPRAHPPKPGAIAKEEINKKERILALKSAIGALTNKELVEKRGHNFNKDLTLPVVCVEEVEKISKTKQVLSFLKKLGLDTDIERAKNRKNIRAGKGKARNRKYKRAKSVLFVISKEKLPLQKSARNLEGVDVVALKNLSTRDLCPGGRAARLTVFSKSAIESLDKRFS
ncbi:MAG: 50S ribosomal protein L4 [Candidatus Diapherotrites archaeon CG08_land_8_20_14_0_20_30_16]|nr:MAG: 50S ribosomal protein L4 [Candidatus Diapherotrites archaeon CG08_land_8_20_14_0_20_30_16]